MSSVGMRWFSHLARRVNRHTQPVFKPRPLDVQVRFDQFDLLAERGEFTIAATEHAAQQSSSVALTSRARVRALFESNSR